MARFLLSFLLLLPAWAAEPTKTVIFGRGPQSSPVATFDKGYLLFLMRPSSFEVWGPDGWLRFFGTVDRPSASVWSVAIDADGSVAAGFAFMGPEGVNGGIAFFDASGAQTHIVETGKYLPANVCFDRNHSLWTFGEQRDSSGYEDGHDYMMFRKYSPDGEEAGRYGSAYNFASERFAARVQRRAARGDYGPRTIGSVPSPIPDRPVQKIAYGSNLGSTAT